MTQRTALTKTAIRKRLIVAALGPLGLVLAGLAALAASHVYWTHIATECGAGCGRSEAQRAVQDGF